MAWGGRWFSDRAGTRALCLPSHEKGRWLKLVSGAVMLVLEVVLIAKPGWLTV
jgi:hypothetical protein